MGLVFFAGSGGVPFAIQYWMFNGDEAFSLSMCLLAAICGTLMLTVYSRQEQLPIAAAFILGPIAGIGTYGATAVYAFGRQNLYILELLIPLFIGAIPGVVAYVVCVRLYFKSTDS